MRKVLTAIAVMTIVIAAAGVTAKAVGTASDTLLVNTATMTASGIPTVTSNPITVTVQDVYGLTAFNEAGANDGTITPGGTTDYVMTVQNNGNMSDGIGIRVGEFLFTGNPGVPGNWSVAVDEDGTVPPFDALTWDNSADVIADPLGDQATTTVGIAPGAAVTFTLRVTADAGAVDTATLEFELGVQTYNTLDHPAAAYTGLDVGLTPYGGDAYLARTVGGAPDFATVTTTVQGAVLTLSKVAVVTAPTGNGYTGGPNDPVPGARIDYTLTYSNTGTGDATNVVITDKLPTDTTLVDGSIDLTGFVTAVQSEEDDGDECDYNVTTADTITCDITKTTTPFTGGSVGNTIEYSVTIN